MPLSCAGSRFVVVLNPSSHPLYTERSRNLHKNKQAVTKLQNLRALGLQCQQTKRNSVSCRAYKFPFSCFSSITDSPNNGDGGGNNNNNNGGGGNGGGEDSSNNKPPPPWKFIFFGGVLICISLASVLDIKSRNDESVEKKDVSEFDVIWEIKGGQRRKVLVDYDKDAFVSVSEGSGTKDGDDDALLFRIEGDGLLARVLRKPARLCEGFILQIMLPEGYPRSVTGDYLEYSLWRMLQSIASQMNSVLSTQALLYAVGLGKGAIPAAAAVNWVLKDGIGYLSKIMLSKYGRNFDVHPKAWRVFADVLENAAHGFELLTPAFPQFFVFLGSVAGAGRSAAFLIQAATKSCFYAGFAAQHNFAEVIAKGEAQGMVSKSLGILFGISLASYAGSSGPLLVGSFAIVTGFHMFCNFKSYQAVQLRTLNPYRASLIFTEYLCSGSIPSVKNVNNEEPLFTMFTSFNVLPVRSTGAVQILSPEATEAANSLTNCLKFGSKFSDAITSQAEADFLFDLYQKEQYLLVEKEGDYIILLRSGASPTDLLRATFQTCYLFQLERNLGAGSREMISDCQTGSKLVVSYDFMSKEFTNAQQKSAEKGWYSEGLVSMPMPYRLQPDNQGK